MLTLRLLAVIALFALSSVPFAIAGSNDSDSQQASQNQADDEDEEGDDDEAGQ